MNTNSIIAQPLGGLCNRMRVIVGAAELARLLKRELIVIWTADSSLNAKFSDLFEPLPFKVIDVRLPSIKQRVLWHWYKDVLRYRVLDDEWIYKNAREIDFSKWRATIENDNILINSNADIIRHDNYSIFTPTEKILKLVRGLDIPQNTIGIHIRRTDSKKSIQYSPTSLFLSVVREEIKKDETIRFYLATDDPHEEETIINEFGDYIIVYKKHSLDRNNPLAIAEALVDLYNLSRCKKIYGSYWSSFSDTAALWTGIEKVELKLK